MAEGRIFSFGGGVQGMAVMVLSGQGKLPYKTFVFANVGEDSENPATLRYLSEHAAPYAEAHGLELVEVKKQRKGEQETIWGRLFSARRSVPLPAFLATGAPGRRVCTTDFKILVVDRWCKRQGLDRVIVGLGISIDEVHRARTTEWEQADNKIWKKREYPLIDLQLTRAQCERIIASADLPVPLKSSCFFCPFHSPAEWVRLRAEHPDLFDKACEVDEALREKRQALGLNPVWLHRALVPLRQAVGEQYMMFNETDFCESGYCMT